jgi:GNAT superfamily N-acetyltransferase
MTLTISVENDASEADRRFVIDSLVAYNRSLAPNPAQSHVYLFLRDEAGAIHGGLLAEVYFGWMFVAILWVDGAHRGGGWGRGLLERAEAEAIARGCHGVWLDTFSFQAPGFYQKLGYEVFGTLDDYPPGHTRYFLRKRLDNGAGRDDASGHPDANPR